MDADGLPVWPERPSARFIAYMVVRRDHLCPDGPKNCGMAQQQGKPKGEPCNNCPVARLDALTQTVEGQLIARALELRFLLQEHVTIPLSDIPADEAACLRVIEDEQQKWDKDPDNPANKKN